jgi:hypothetical protein
MTLRTCLENAASQVCSGQISVLWQRPILKFLYIKTNLRWSWILKWGVSNPALYSGGTRFNSRPWDRLSWLGFIQANDELIFGTRQTSLNYNPIFTHISCHATVHIWAMKRVYFMLSHNTAWGSITIVKKPIPKIRQIARFLHPRVRKVITWILFVYTKSDFAGA